MEPISRIDSSTNQLFFRGINAIELAKESDYESVLYLLIHGSLPSTKQRDEIVTKMTAFRNLYSKDMDSLQSLAANFDKMKREHSLEWEDSFLAFVSLSAVVAAASLMKTRGLEYQMPNSDLGFAANFLLMSIGKEPSPQDIRDFQSCLILHMDDPDNPSLTGLSKVISENNSISMGLTTALTEHVGVLHHGAGTEAVRMFEEAVNSETIVGYLRQRIQDGNKIFGMGHRIYRGFDPRALFLKGMLHRRALKTENEWLIEVIEKVTLEGSSLLSELKGIQAYPNVDLYNAATYATFGYPPEFNTTLFALARVAGWSAHIRELQLE
ncbi:MAG: citrate/2-methylcitrate synthase [Candidatus Thorarchaeota archaeon]|nr:MAG: citrate/2-methylcitrate synthase [Candidatus Thorarchaeota archaeon]